MSTEHVLDITREALKISVMISAPILICGLVVGVMTNVFQAVTQISETTLAVVPKMLAMMLAFAVFMPWMIDMIVDFTTQLLSSIPNIIR